MYRTFQPAISFVEKEAEGDVEIKACEVAEMKEASQFVCTNSYPVKAHRSTQSDQLPVVDR